MTCKRTQDVFTLDHNYLYTNSRYSNETLLNLNNVAESHAKHLSSSKSIQNTIDLRKDILIYYQNMGGMRSSLNEFRNDIANCPYAAAMITEHWLQKQHLDAEIVPDNWFLFRKDRTLGTNSDTVGGGVLIAVDNSTNLCL